MSNIILAHSAATLTAVLGKRSLPQRKPRVQAPNRGFACVGLGLTFSSRTLSPPYPLDRARDGSRTRVCGRVQPRHTAAPPTAWNRVALGAVADCSALVRFERARGSFVSTAPCPATLFGATLGVFGLNPFVMALIPPPFPRPQAPTSTPLCEDPHTLVAPNGSRLPRSTAFGSVLAGSRTRAHTCTPRPGARAPCQVLRVSLAYQRRGSASRPPRRELHASLQVGAGPLATTPRVWF
jgi:hypothetical protein